MRAISIPKIIAVPVVLLGILSVASADALEEKLEKEYPLTTVNAEGEVVTQGAVLVLKKSGLTAGATKACTNDYVNGQIKLGGSLLSKAACLKVGGEGVGGATRAFVKGEKVSVSKIEMVKDAVAFSLISDPVSDVRYKAELKFPIQKGAAPDLAQVDQMITQVFSIAPPAPPADQAPASGAAQGGAPQGGPRFRQSSPFHLSSLRHRPQTRPRRHRSRPHRHRRISRQPRRKLSRWA